MMLDHLAAFDALKNLTGKWSGVDENGHPTHIDYSLTANNTALVEDWTFHNGGTALTIYHMDEAVLMAMHYCPIGNQPRLNLIRQLDNGTLEFKCVSATNLKDFSAPHEHAFDLKINADGTLYRNETYVEDNGSLESNGILFQRLA